MPGMTEQSQVPKMFAAAGLVYPTCSTCSSGRPVARSERDSIAGSCPLPGRTGMPTRWVAGMTRRISAWWPDLALGVAWRRSASGRSRVRPGRCFAGGGYLVVLGMAVAAGLYRRSPEAALALVWLSCAFQVLTGLDVMLDPARGASWRSARPLRADGGRVAQRALDPRGAVIAIAYVARPGHRSTLLRRRPASAAARLLLRRRPGSSGCAPLCLLAIPWLVGLVLRIGAQARTSPAQAAADAPRQARSQAEEIAQLREEQARLARDVHDVVGHSLAVILAQAESAQFLQDADTEALKRTMENIATSARSSLQDVRQVLTTAHGRRPRRDRRPRQPDRGRASGGHEVPSTVVGTPQPLPPELEVVAFRVLQEMLTNAIKHGRRERAGAASSGTGRASCGSRCATIEVAQRPAARRPRRSPEPGPGAGRHAPPARVGRRASRRTPS